MTRPWSVAAALAAVFVALQDLYSVVSLMIFVVAAGDDFDAGDRWEIIRSEWGVHLTYLLIGLVAAYVLRLAAHNAASLAWPPLVLRAVILFVPAALVVNFVVTLVYALTHDTSFQFLGITIF